MADTCATFNFGSVVVNPDPTTDGLQTTDEGDVQGLDGAPITGQIDPKGAAAGASGSIVQNKALRGRVIVFTGFVHIGTEITEEGGTPNVGAIRQKTVAVEKAVVAALEALLNTPTALTWTDAEGDSFSITATYGTEGGEITFSGPMLNRAYSFTLVTETPTISAV